MSNKRDHVMGHPLFPPKVDDAPWPDVQKIIVQRMERGRMVTVGHQFDAAQIQGEEDIAAMFGGGEYTLKGRNGAGQHVRSVSFLIAGTPKPLAPPDPQAGAPSAEGGAPAAAYLGPGATIIAAIAPAALTYLAEDRRERREAEERRARREAEEKREREEERQRFLAEQDRLRREAAEEARKAEERREERRREERREDERREAARQEAFRQQMALEREAIGKAMEQRAALAPPTAGDPLAQIVMLEKARKELKKDDELSTKDMLQLLPLLPAFFGRGGGMPPVMPQA